MRFLFFALINFTVGMVYAGPRPVLCTVPGQVLLVLAGCLTIHAGTYTRIFQDGHGGYLGTRDATISSDAPDQNQGAQDGFVTRRDPARSFEAVGLIKFTGLDLPADARIVSGKLTLAVRELGNVPAISAYGLLKNFAEGTKNFQPPSEGESTWNSVRHGQRRWDVPGGGASTQEFRYDGDADRHVPADDRVIVEAGASSCTWDVTMSLRSQVTQGKEYGWALVTEDTEVDAYGAFFSRQWPSDDGPVSLLPRLMVTYESTLADSGPASLTGAKLILYYGLHPSKMQDDPERLKQFPFDGISFRASTAGLEIFGPRRAAGIEQWAGFIDDVRATLAPPSGMTDHFFEFTTYPGTADPGANLNWDERGQHRDVRLWYSDFGVILHNVTVMAQIARRAGMVGLLFDWETYGRNIFKYAHQADAHKLGKTVEETRAQVRKQGERFVQAINTVYPDVTLMVIPRFYHGGYGSDYELINPFLDGIVAAADPRMRIVDGNEAGYYASTVHDFRQLRDGTLTAMPGDPGLHEKYRRQMGVGLGVWLERNGWSDQPERNNITPARWEVLLEDALRTADTYVWVYHGGSGSPGDWWTGSRLPQAYFDATRRSRDLSRRRWMGQN